MTLPTRTVEPTAFVAGELVEWTKQFNDYPATAWGLVYKIRGPGTGIDVTATADGDAFVLSILPATSDDITVAGRYRIQGVVTKTSDATQKHVVYDGWVKVTLLLASATTTVETRSTAKQIVDAIDTALLADSGAVIEYEISTPAGTRRVKKDRKAAREDRNYYASIVAREASLERAKAGGSIFQTADVRFVD
jgi:hypothetical protein